MVGLGSFFGCGEEGGGGFSIIQSVQSTEYRVEYIV